MAASAAKVAAAPTHNDSDGRAMACRVATSRIYTGSSAQYCRVSPAGLYFGSSADGECGGHDSRWALMESRLQWQMGWDSNLALSISTPSIRSAAWRFGSGSTLHRAASTATLSRIWGTPRLYGPRHVSFGQITSLQPLGQPEQALPADNRRARIPPVQRHLHCDNPTDLLKSNPIAIACRQAPR